MVLRDFLYSSVETIEPMWEFSEFLKFNLLNENTLFIGTVSYEDRCKTGFFKVFNSKKHDLLLFIFEIEDDECTYADWRERCIQKTEKNWDDIKNEASRCNIQLDDHHYKYLMSKRREDIINLFLNIKDFLDNVPSEKENIRCILDVSVLPSYFALQLIKQLVDYGTINDLILIYTIPRSYPTKGPLKKSSPLESKAEPLPLFSNANSADEDITWILSLGFDYESIKNAERISRIKNIKKIYPIIPFPGYEPKYVIRTMLENKEFLSNPRLIRQVLYAPADNPFRTFYVLNRLTINISEEVILSSFGPKPMCIGFGLAAMMLNHPILHVQATNYNPDFSFGEKKTLSFWIKHNGKMWWEYLPEKERNQIVN